MTTPTTPTAPGGPGRAIEFAFDAHAWLAAPRRITWTLLSPGGGHLARGDVRGLTVAYLSRVWEHCRDTGQLGVQMALPLGKAYDEETVDTEEEGKVIAEHALAVFGALVYRLPAPPPISAVRAAVRGETQLPARAVCPQDPEHYLDSHAPGGAWYGRGHGKTTPSPWRPGLLDWVTDTLTGDVAARDPHVAGQWFVASLDGLDGTRWNLEARAGSAALFLGEHADLDTAQASAQRHADAGGNP